MYPKMVIFYIYTTILKPDRQSQPPHPPPLPKSDIFIQMYSTYILQTFNIHTKTVSNLPSWETMGM